MKHLKRFNEAFIIPKPVRKFMPFWGDEEIGLILLKELKNMKATPENISDLKINIHDKKDFLRTYKK